MPLVSGGSLGARNVRTYWDPITVADRIAGDGRNPLARHEDADQV